MKQPVYDPVDDMTDMGHTDLELRTLLERFYEETWAMRRQRTSDHPVPISPGG